MGADVIVVIVVATALAFDFTNGFHDTANVVATSISTRAMAPRIAVGYAAILNFAGAFISLQVAATVANDVVDASSITLLAVFAGLVGAIAWNLITWWFGLPSSSSHALIGGIVGAVLVAEGPSAIFFEEGILGKVMIPAVVAPILAFVVGGLSILFLYRIVGRLRPGPVTGGFRLGQVISGGLLALAHGTNDAQKTMGVIALALVANGSISESDFHIPDWVVVSSALAIALGHLRGRLAHHQDDGQPHPQDGHRTGLRRTGRRGHGDPVGVPGGIPALDDSHDLGRRDRLGRGQAPLGRALGRGGQHRDRVDPDPAGRRDDRRGDLPRDPRLRHRSGGADRRIGADRGRLGGHVRAPRAGQVARRAVRHPGERMIATIVDASDLLHVVWVSLAAGVGVTAIYGIAIVGGTRALEFAKAGRPGGAIVFGALGVLAMAVVLGAIVLGIVALIHR